MARVLLIEDDELSMITVAKFLASGGHGVAEATDGEKALARDDLDTFDLVVTDLIMPNREGISTIGELKVKYPEKKIMVITGGGSFARPRDMYADMALKLGADAALLKPFSQAEFLAVVDQVLNTSPP